MVKIEHPELPGQPIEVTEKQLEVVWSKRGWQRLESPKRKERTKAKNDDRPKED